MGICQWIMFVLALLSLGIAMEKHGQPKTGYYNFWTYLISWVFNSAYYFLEDFSHEHERIPKTCSED